MEEGDLVHILAWPEVGGRAQAHEEAATRPSEGWVLVSLRADPSQSGLVPSECLNMIKWKHSELGLMLEEDASVFAWSRTSGDAKNGGATPAISKELAGRRGAWSAPRLRPTPVLHEVPV